MFSRPAAPLIDAVLAGREVDWQDATARYGATIDLRQLRALSAIAQHSHSAPSRRPGVSHPFTQRPVAAAIAALASLQILAAGYGYFTGAGRLDAVPVTAAILTVAVFSASSLALLTGGRQDDRAVSLGLCFLLIAAAFCRRFVPRLTPLASVMDGVFPDAFIATFFWDFVRRFPRTPKTSGLDRFSAGMVTVSAVIGALLFIANVLLARGASFVPTWLHRSSASGLYWIVVLGLALGGPLVTIAKTRRSPPSEQRRVAVLAFGLAVILAPITLETIAEASLPSFAAWMAQPNIRAAASPFFFGLLLAAPLITTYAVVVRAALDVRFIVGKTLQYAVARNTTRVLTLVPIGALIWLGYVHRDQTIAQLAASGRGIVVIAALSLAGFSAVAREQAMRLIDAWFLRERVDFTGELTALTGRIAASRSEAELADTVQKDLGRVLKVRHVIMLIRDDSNRLVPIWADAPSLPADGAVSAVLSADRSAFTLRPTSTESLIPLFPPAEQAWIERTATEVLVPLTASLDAVLGMMAIGTKRNEDVFSQEELSFLTATGAACALALEHRHPREPATTVSRRLDPDPAVECMHCGRVDADRTGRCVCGGVKRVASLPQLLAGKFAVDQYVGAGGMGVVYRATDKTLGRSVALKTLASISGKAVQRLTREARIMATVAHPNLATIYGVEIWRDTPILVLEFLDGDSLVPRLERPMSPRDALQLGVLLAPALEQLHEAGILHGDIKPSNVGFSRDGVPKLLDFGIAQVLSEAGTETSTPSGRFSASATTTQVLLTCDSSVIAGTPLYMSPERASGSRATIAVDLWAFALLLYEAIAGAHPFKGHDVGQVLQKVRLAQIPDIRQLRPDCPGAIADAFRTLLAPDPALRPQTATELRRQLDRLLAQLADVRENAVQNRGNQR